MTDSRSSILNANYSFKTSYHREELEIRIVHIGFGAFHRGHQAVYNDLTNQGIGQLKETNRWGVCEINMFGSSELIDQLKAQDYLFTVIEKSAESTHSRLVRTITEAIHTPKDGIQKALDKLVEPQVSIVSLTITEKGYCVDPQSRQLDTGNELIQYDLTHPSTPQSAIGLITEALRLRKQAGLNGFTVMSCDNIPENGSLTRDAVLSYAKQLDEELHAWIIEKVTFPSTMVDRIVPAMTSEQFDTIEQETGYRDPCGIVCEDFRQWVIEDNFVSGRPQWELAGAMLVDDVLPYEEMKLRMLNGSHSFLAYNGSLAGYEYIYQCMEDDIFRKATLALMTEEQAKSLNPTLNVDLNEYAQLLISRFSNKNIKHKTNQIAMDGSQKLPQRAVDPYLTLQQRGLPRRYLPILLAGWIHYLLRQGNELVDPLVNQFLNITQQNITSLEKAKQLLNIEKIFGLQGRDNPEFNQQVLDAFNKIEKEGISTTIAFLN